MLVPSIQDTLPLIQAYGYPLIFILMFIEGPIITYIAAFAASLGLFNIYVIFVLSIFGNVLPDLVYYTIGSSIKKESIYKYFEKSGIKEGKIKSLENNLRKHSGKMMLTVKIVPMIPPLGLTIAGRVLPFKRFLFLSVLISAVYSLVFFSLGYFSGQAFNLILPYVKYGEIIIGAIIVLFVILWVLIQRFISRKIEGL
jgi:membrane protein DedA with SNARE-associated domain